MLRNRVRLHLIGGFVLVILGVSSYSALFAASSSAIPLFGSADFGWDGVTADWLQPPPGYGRGPVGDDPEHPYRANIQGGQPTLRIGNSKDTVLKSWAAAQMLASNEEVLNGIRAVPFAAQAQCYPGGVPTQWLFPEPMFFIQTPKEIWIIWQRDHMVRRILLDGVHSKNVKPSWFGESVGHYEGGDTLVVDTVGLQSRNSYLDNFRTAHTDQEHVVERYTIAPDGKTMTGVATVEDAGALNEPISMQQRWRKSGGRLIETACAENNPDVFHQNLFPIPQTKTPDF